LKLTDRQRDYIDYLDSPTWRCKRSQALARDGFRCRICNSDKSPTVHHRKYPKILGTEAVEDLTTLCSRCHDLFHHKVQKKPKKLSASEIRRRTITKNEKRRRKAERKMFGSKLERIQSKFEPAVILRKAV
jgi:5-methylcytosine-specific restriction endonuclease McrA